MDVEFECEKVPGSLFGCFSGSPMFGRVHRAHRPHRPCYSMLGRSKAVLPEGCALTSVCASLHAGEIVIALKGASGIPAAFRTAHCGRLPVAKRRPEDINRS